MSKIKYHSYAQLKAGGGSTTETELIYEDPFLITAEDTLEVESRRQQYEDLILKRGIPVSNVGDIINGTVVYLSQDGLGIECGYKSTVEVASRGKDAALVQAASIGDSIEVSIVEITESPYSI